MTVQAVPIPVHIEPELILNQRSWTLEEYEAMISAGVLGDQDRVELLFGKIVDMSPIGVSHAYHVQEMNKFMVLNFDGRFVGRQGQPVAFPLHSMPEPDYVLAKRHKHRYRDRRPGPEDIELIVEVSDSTLGRDRGSKMKLYAAYGIKEYWILNLIDRQLELYTEPTETEGYANRLSIPRDETFVSPLLGEFRAADVMPRAKYVGGGVSRSA